MWEDEEVRIDAISDDMQTLKEEAEKLMYWSMEIGHDIGKTDEALLYTTRLIDTVYELEEFLKDD